MLSGEGMEGILVESVQNSLRQFIYPNAIFICERLCAEFPSEVCASLCLSFFIFPLLSKSNMYVTKLSFGYQWKRKENKYDVFWKGGGIERSSNGFSSAIKALVASFEMRCCSDMVDVCSDITFFLLQCRHREGSARGELNPGPFLRKWYLLSNVTRPNALSSHETWLKGSRGQNLKLGENESQELEFCLLVIQMLTLSRILPFL